MKENKIGYRDILRQKEYMKTIIADIINRFGDSIDSVAITWLVYQVTQSAAWSAIIFGVNRIPSVFLQPFAGALIEGRNKKKIMVLTDIIRGLCVGLVATSIIFGFVNEWLLLLTTIIISSAEAFRGPASTALLPKMLDKKYYEFGISLSRSTSSATELIGLGVAGAVIAMTSVATAIYIDMATFFLSALILFTLRVKEEAFMKAKINAKEYMETLKEGFIYVKETPFLRYFIVLGVFLNAVLVPINSLIAPLASEILHSGEYMISVLGIGLSVGMLIGATAYPYLSRRMSKRMIISIGGYSIALFYFSFILVGRFVTSSLWTAIIVGFVSLLVGLAISLLSSFCGVEFMKCVEEKYLARTSAIFNAGAVAAMPIVAFLISAIAGFASTAALFLIAGGLDVLICIKLCSKKIFKEMKEKEATNDAEMRDSDRIVLPAQEQLETVN